MTQGIDLGIETRATYDDEGHPTPPMWMTEMVELGLLKVIPFDREYVLALDPTPEGARVTLRTETRAVSFIICGAALSQCADMTRSVYGKGALADAAPLPTVATGATVEEYIGDFQVFAFIRTETGVVLYARAADTRWAVRLTMTKEDFTRFAVSLIAARDVHSVKLEKLSIQYTMISSKNPVETPEAFRDAVRTTRSASGRGGALASVNGGGLDGLIPDEILSKYDADGMLIATDEPAPVMLPPRRYEPQVFTWVAAAAVVIAVAAAIAYRFF